MDIIIIQFEGICQETVLKNLKFFFQRIQQMIQQTKFKNKISVKIQK